MPNLPTTLGKLFIIAAFVPALIFGVLNWLFIAPLIAPDLALSNVTLNLSELDLEEWASFLVIAPSVVGMVLMALNTPIVRFFEGTLEFEREHLLGHLLERNRSRHETLYKDLNTFRVALEAEEDPFKRRSLLRAMRREHSRIFARDDIVDLTLPYNPDRLAPTRLGNIFAVVEEYPHQRYSMDAMTFWPRLLSVIPDEYQSMMADEKTTLDFLLNLSLLSMVFGIETLLAFVMEVSEASQPWRFLALTAGAWFVALGLYRGAVFTALSLGELIKSCFDLFRGELLTRFGLEQPADFQEERQLWAGLTNYLVAGEPFYYPGRDES